MTRNEFNALYDEMKRNIDEYQMACPWLSMYQCARAQIDANKITEPWLIYQLIGYAERCDKYNN